MGFFSSLKKVFNPGGAVVSKVINDGRDYQGLLDYGMHGQDQAKKNQDAQKQAQKDQYTQKPMFSPDPGLNPQAQQLGWTNGGYNYHNSPFNQPQPTPFGQPAGPGGGGGPPMSFGGVGQPPPRNQAMGLQPPMQGGSMPPAGAPIGQPTKQFRIPEQEALIAGLRRV
jgi:hypothetical protein